jgi:hypothetical protein
MTTGIPTEGTFSHRYAFEEGGFVGFHRGPAGESLVVARPGGPARTLPVQRVECAGASGPTRVWTTWGVLHVPSPDADGTDPMRFATFAGCRLVSADRRDEVADEPAKAYGRAPGIHGDARAPRRAFA